MAALLTSRRGQHFLIAIAAGIISTFGLYVLLGGPHVRAIFFAESNTNASQLVTLFTPTYQWAVCLFCLVALVVWPVRNCPKLLSF
jgi:hypothetical protein